MTPAEQAALLRLGWAVMFGMGLTAASLLLFLVAKDRVDLGERNGVLRAQANSTLSDGALLWLCALSGLMASIAAWLTLPLLALGSLVAFGLLFNVLILNMLRGRRAVTRSLRLTLGALEDSKARERAARRTT